MKFLVTKRAPHRNLSIQQSIIYRAEQHIHKKRHTKWWMDAP